jgi:hypothetical protein
MPGGRPQPRSVSNQQLASAQANAAAAKTTTPPTEAKQTRPLGPGTSAEVVDKTLGNVSTPPLEAPNTGTNVLNSFRSYTYKFTLAGLDSKVLETPTIDVFQKSSENLIILRSGGKGNSVMTPTESSDDIATSMIKSFNSGSPGRFDLFIDNVEIETTMAFNEQTGVTLPTAIRFEVFEPYSINGFIEALQVASVAAGYVSYTSASFILKMEFLGYPDDSVDLLAPKTVPNSTRYFVIGFTGVEVELTERGTRYRVAAVPYNEIGFANLDSKLAQSVQVQGYSVGTILDNFMKTLTEQRAAAAKESKATVKGSDTYSIVFPTWVEGKGFDYSTPNKILVDSPFAVNLKDNKIFSFADVTDTKIPNAYKIDKTTIAASTSSTATSFFARLGAAGDTTVNFASGSNIQDCIAAVISDSDYTRNLLKVLKDRTDSYGMVDYFLIKLEITNQKIINDQSKLPYRDFKYVVTPYKVHYTSLPNYSDQTFDVSKYKYRAVREYNYLYTGKNVDVLNFKLNFNTLFFEAMGNAMGNNDRVSAQTAGSQDDNVKVQSASQDTDSGKDSSIPTAGRRVLANLTQNSNSGNPSASVPQDDPFWLLSRAMYKAVTNSNTSMITGEIDIIGDPFYCTAGGIGNYKPNSAGINKNDDGSVDKDYGQVLIIINFKNPEDFQAVDRSGNGGMPIFVPKQAAFSGVYKVLGVVSSFREGLFKQKLNIMRMPQTDNTGITPVKAEDAKSTPAVDTKPNPTAQGATDSNPTGTAY